MFMYVPLVRSARDVHALCSASLHTCHLSLLFLVFDDKAAQRRKLPKTDKFSLARSIPIAGLIKKSYFAKCCTLQECMGAKTSRCISLGFLTLGSPVSVL